MRRVFSVLPVVMLMAAVPCVAHDQNTKSVSVMTDLVPRSAMGTLLFRNVNELKQRGDAVTARLGHPGAISMLGKIAGASLVLGELIDDDRPCGAVWFEHNTVEKPNRHRMHPIAVALGVRKEDLDAVADRLEIKREALEQGETATGKGQIGYEHWFARLQGDYVWFTSHEELFPLVLEREDTLTDVLPESRREIVRDMDALMAVNAEAADVNRGWIVGEAEHWLEKNNDLDPEEKHVISDFFSMFKAVSWAMVSVRIEDGMAFNFDVFFDPKYYDAIDTILQRFNPQRSASTLSGLPDAPLLLAHAAHVEGEVTLPVMAVLFRELQQHWTPRWKQFNQRKFLSGVQQLELLGVFGEVWGRIKAYRTAVYRNSEPNRHGLMSLVAVLDTHDADELVAEVRELAGFVDGTGLPLSRPGEPPPAATEEVIRKLIRDLADRRYQVRQSATVRLTLIGEPALELVTAAEDSRLLEVRRRATRIRERIEAKVKEARNEALKPGLIREAKPTFVFHAAEELRLGRTVHIVEMKTAPGAEVERHMHTAFGIGWRQIRFVPHGSRLVVLVGSDTSLLDRTLKNLDGNKPGLATSQAERLATRPVHSQRVAEFRIGVSRFLDLARMTQPGTEKDDDSDDAGEKTEDDPPEDIAELSGVGLTIHREFVLLQWRMSVEDLKDARSWWF